MDSLPQECMVYYLNENIIAAARVRSKIKKIDEEMQNTREEVKRLHAAQEALLKIESLLRQMRRIAELASADDPPFSRELLDKQFQKLRNDITDIIASSEYGGVNLLDGSLGTINGIIASLGKAIL